MELIPPTNPQDGDAFLVNAWVVRDGDQDEFVSLIEVLFDHLRTLEGFIEGAILRGVNPTRFVSYARMRSPQDRQRLFDDKEVSTLLRAVDAIADTDLHSYDILRSYAT